MADKKPSNRERIKEIVTGIETGIQDLFQSDKMELLTKPDPKQPASNGIATME